MKNSNVKTEEGMGRKSGDYKVKLECMKWRKPGNPDVQTTHRKNRNLKKT